MAIAPPIVDQALGDALDQKEMGTQAHLKSHKEEVRTVAISVRIQVQKSGTKKGCSSILMEALKAEASGGDNAFKRMRQ